MPLLLDGKKVRDEMRARLKASVESDLKKGLPKRCLAIIQIGDNPESSAYISQKKKFGEAIGVSVAHIALPESASESEIISKIAALNGNAAVNGIIVQMPLPAGLGKDRIIEAINPSKDVDGLTAANVKKLWSGGHDKIGGEGVGLVPATARAVITLLDYYAIALAGKHAVIIGRSELVGKPLALALLNRDATVTLCHSKTRDLPSIAKTADILIAATGKPRFVTADCAAAGQTVVDVGITVQESQSASGAKRLIGDVDFDAVGKVIGDAGAISPVPGGVGPLTVACLFENLLQAAAMTATA